MIHTIFVYGTLKALERGHRALRDCVYLGEGVARHFGLVDIGAFPGLLPCRCCEQDWAKGEVYDAGSNIKHLLAWLDNYEQEGQLYKRLLVPISMEDDLILCWTYVFLPSVELVEGGVWRANDAI